VGEKKIESGGGKKPGTTGQLVRRWGEISEGEGKNQRRKKNRRSERIKVAKYRREKTSRRTGGVNASIKKNWR